MSARYGMGLCQCRRDRGKQQYPRKATSRPLGEHRRVAAAHSVNHRAEFNASPSRASPSPALRRNGDSSRADVYQRHTALDSSIGFPLSRLTKVAIGEAPRSEGCSNVVRFSWQRICSCLPLPLIADLSSCSCLSQGTPTYRQCLDILNNSSHSVVSIYVTRPRSDPRF